MVDRKGFGFILGKSYIGLVRKSVGTFTSCGRGISRAGLAKTRCSSFFNEARPGSLPETEDEQERTRRVCKNAVEGGLCIAVLVGDSFGQPSDIFG